MAMLDALDSIEWTSVKHAYGPADDTPAQLRALLSDDAKARELALDELGSSICHQGTIYEATLYAVPYLIELLGAPDVRDKAQILYLLACIAEGGFPDRYVTESRCLLTELDTAEARREIEERWGWVHRTHAAVREGREVYLHLLDDRELEARQGALLVLVGSLRSDGAHVAPALRLRIAVEEDRTQRASLARGLGGFAPIDDTTRTLLTHIRSDDADPLIQLAATAALAHADGEQAPAGVEADLALALTQPDSLIREAYSQLIGDSGWECTDYETDLALALRAMGPRGTAAALPLLTNALAEGCAAATPETLPPGRIFRWAKSSVADDGTRSWTNREGQRIDPPTPELRLADALLTFAFGARHGGQKAPSSLSAEQWTVLQAVSECDAIWRFDANMDGLLADRGLPSTRDGLRDYMARVAR